MNDDLGRMVLIDDVNVRSWSYGKCSMCIQMTQATILNAKREEKWLMENFKLHVQMLVLMEQWLLEMLMIKESQITKLADDEECIIC
jgi:molybdopterin-containing oxidoreductase family iron-sulfur binding subunit